MWASPPVGVVHMEPARTSCSSLVGFVADGTGCHILFILASRVYPEKTNYGHVMLPAIPAPEEMQ